MWNLKDQTLKQRIEGWLPVAGRGENGEMLDKEYKLPIIRWTHSWDLVYSLVIIVNNTLFCAWKLLKE